MKVKQSRVVASSYRARKGMGGGVRFAESFFRNQREGRWLVMGGIEAQSWGLGMGRD